MVLEAIMLAFLLATVVSHGAMVVRIFRQRPWRAPLAVVFPMLGPYWGWQSGARWTAFVWVLGVVGYTFLLAVLVK
jgi:hypothetical protein